MDFSNLLYQLLLQFISVIFHSCYGPCLHQLPSLLLILQFTSFLSLSPILFYSFSQFSAALSIVAFISIAWAVFHILEIWLMSRRMNSCPCSISNAFDLCSERSRFESRQKLRLSWLKHFVSLCKKVRDGTSIRRQPVPSKCFPIHHSSIVLTFEALLCNINTNRSTKQTMDLSEPLLVVSVHRFNCGQTLTNPRETWS